MGRRYSQIAAKIRITERSMKHEGLSISLQDKSLSLQAFHFELIGHNVHFAAQAAYLARPFITHCAYTWSRGVHKEAGTERYNAYVGGSCSFRSVVLKKYEDVYQHREVG
jgi:hypothetical protein